MGIFNNIVGGMPNIYMAPAVSTTELTLPGQKISAGKTAATKKDATDKEDKLNVLVGDSLELQVLDKGINSIKNKISSIAYGLVKDYHGDLTKAKTDVRMTTLSGLADNLSTKEMEYKASLSKATTDKTDHDALLKTYRGKDLLEDYNIVDIGGINYRQGKDTKTGETIYHGINNSYLKESGGKLVEIKKPVVDNYKFVKNIDVFEQRQYNKGLYKDIPYATADYGWEYTKGDLDKTLRANFTNAAGQMNQITAGGAYDVSKLSGYNLLWSATGQKSNLSNLTQAVAGAYEELSDTEKKEATQQYFYFKNSYPDSKYDFNDWWKNKLLTYKNELRSTLGGEQSAASLGKAKSAVGGSSDVALSWIQSGDIGALDFKATKGYLTLPLTASEKSEIEKASATAIGIATTTAKAALKGKSLEDLTEEELKTINDYIAKAGSDAENAAFEKSSLFKTFSKMSATEIKTELDKKYSLYKGYYIPIELTGGVHVSNYVDMGTNVNNAINTYIKSGKALNPSQVSSIMVDPTQAINYGVSVKHITMTSGDVSKAYQGTPITANEELYTNNGTKVTIGKGIAYHINPYEMARGLIKDKYKIPVPVTTQTGTMDLEGVTNQLTETQYETANAIMGAALVTDEQLENMKKTNPNIESRDVSDVELDIVEKSRGLTTGSLKSEKYTKVVKTIGKDVLQLHDIIYPATGEQTDKELDIFNNATSTSTVNTAKNENIISTPY